MGSLPSWKIKTLYFHVLYSYSIKNDEILININTVYFTKGDEHTSRFILEISLFILRSF